MFPLLEHQEAANPLLSLLAGLEVADSGEIWVDGEEIHALTEPQRVAFRRQKLGFVFQSFQLFPHFTALENVLFPLELSNTKRARAELVDKAKSLLDQLGLGDRLEHFPAQLSGGEQQRVAIARSFAAEPTLLLADEPTGNLDTETGLRVMAQFEALRAQHQLTVLMVTHDPAIAKQADRCLRMTAGQLSEG